MAVFLWLEFFHIIILSVFYVLCAILLTKMSWKFCVGKLLSDESHWSEKARILFSARVGAGSLVVVFPVAIITIFSTYRYQIYEITPLILKLWWFSAIALFACITTSSKIYRLYVATSQVSTIKSLGSSWLLLYPHLLVALIFMAMCFLIPQSYLWLWIVLFAMCTWLMITKWSLMITKWLKLIIPAPQLQEMLPSDKNITTYLFYHRSANAFAMTMCGAICVSEKLYRLLDRAQLESIMLHEYQHFEKKQNTARSFFCAVPFLLVSSYYILSVYEVSLYWMIPIFLLIIVIKNIALKIFVREEQEIDAFVSENMDNKAYASALEKVHEVNLIPAVVTKNLTHPHLYDRMLDSGVTPDFSRPAPPPKNHKMIFVIFLAVMLLVTPQILSVFLRTSGSLNGVYGHMIANGIGTRNVYQLANIHFQNKNYSTSAMMFGKISDENSNYGDYAVALTAQSYALAGNINMARIYWQKTKARIVTSHTLQHEEKWLADIENLIESK
ncbi:M48 family metalloprotease [Candidatus Uabimicrobium sp. HlEnr_7]|uniref:M48 family metalloprotease n=1 Tax=Candidatus Uabimicrobium helgolandensis TaxID=3095367 RepID=UPI0035586A46